MPINPYERVQTKYTFQEHVKKYGSNRKGYCRCGCGKKLKGKQRKWATPACSARLLHSYWILKGSGQYIRKALYDIEQGICVRCGTQTEDWQADHIQAVANGGGGKGLENYQTLCLECHKQKTKIDLSQAS